ncbi:ATP-binding protein [Saccharopolyspora griseoalba]|uniref:ATP-binding protein n=1 Tax=Saccharopolyspora griseoalba TaxID=1431848 RepID=A0ABW2LMX9_9PSEU
MAFARSGGPDGHPPGSVAHLQRSGVPASAGSLPVLRDELTAWARATGLHEGVAESLALASYEAMANAVEHAYGGASGLLDVEAVRHADRVQVTITDHGSWVPEREGERHRQRGLPLIRRLADDAVVNSDENGTTVLMNWRLPAEADGTPN